MSASTLVAETVWKSVESTRSVSEDQLSILFFLFGKNLEKATRIVDQRGVKKISGEPSGRFIFQNSGPCLTTKWSLTRLKPRSTGRTNGWTASPHYITYKISGLMVLHHIQQMYLQIYVDIRLNHG
ncbi:uncharacterized protein LOC123207957 isoform X2 [Mangifera indica]|uniref:uncharacterized protein LOC123207957 isoform X2 n=1 Tax=Mangifera indica TaxID=29780 RepID=UPI001CFB1D33|nr:uncharacterized protein LOC123207957 isoform X2 [Mangifera indica]